MDHGISAIDEADLHGKRVLLRTDFNVSLHPDHSVADDERIARSLPTIRHLLSGGNRLVVMTHLGRPKAYDPSCSLAPVAERLRQLLPAFRVTLVPDLAAARTAVLHQASDEILLLENLRFDPREKANDASLARELAALADVYVNDAFANCHRAHASMVGVPALLPAYAGLLLKREMAMLGQITATPRHPFVAIVGGAKVSTKIGLLGRLTEIADTLLIGGAMANTFLKAQGHEVGKSLFEADEVERARQLLDLAKRHGTRVVLPSDVVVATAPDDPNGHVRRIGEVGTGESIFDIGPETEAEFGLEIAAASMLVWNGPVGLAEQPSYRRGTDFVYYSVAEKASGMTIVGGGDTLAAISKREYLERITHVSTGGGAMLEFLEKGTLVAIEALRGRSA